MARPRKRGLDYFPVDIDMFHDMKIRKLMRQHGASGACAFTILLCEIYKNGYFVEISDELLFSVSETACIDEGAVLNIIEYALELGLFNQDIFEQHKVLTSVAIQRRFSFICRQLHRSEGVGVFNLLEESDNDVSSEEILVSSEEIIAKKGDKIIKTRKIVSSEEIDVLSDEIMVSSEETPVSSYKTGVYSLESTQKKRKEIKRKKIKEKKPTSTTPDVVVEVEKTTPSSEELISEKSVFEEAEILRQEISGIWGAAISEKFKIDRNAISGLIDKWVLHCISQGKDSHPKGITDVKSHFTWWLNKTINPTGGTKGKTIESFSSRSKTKLNDRPEYQRPVKTEDESPKTSPADYIRSKGYDPTLVTMAQVLNPNWREHNPPTIDIARKISIAQSS